MPRQTGSRLRTRPCVWSQGGQRSEILPALSSQGTCTSEVRGKLSLLKNFKYTSLCPELPPGLFVSDGPVPWGSVRMSLGRGGSTHRVPREPPSPGFVVWTSDSPWWPGAATFWASRPFLPPHPPLRPHVPHLRRQALAIPLLLTSFCCLGHHRPQQITWVLCFPFPL